MRGTLFFGALVLLLGGVVLAAASDERDVFDRPVAPQLLGRPRLVLYTNRNTKEETADPASRMAIRLRDVGYVTVVRVDLRGIIGEFL